MHYFKPNDLQRIEKLLSAFHKYTYDHYAVLQLKIVRLCDYLDSKPANIPLQVRKDLKFELEHHAEDLKSVRFSNNKDEDFQQHIKAVITIIQRLKPYVAHSVQPVQHPTASFWDWLKWLWL